jgi:hypothetical protein
MSDFTLSDESLCLLDIIANIEYLHEYEISSSWLVNGQYLNRDQLSQLLTQLLNLQLISSSKDEYQRMVYSLNPAMKDKISLILSSFWEHQKIEKSNLLEAIKEDYSGVLKLLEFRTSVDKSQNKLFRLLCGLAGKEIMPATSKNWADF